MAKNYHDDVENALKIARLGKAKWDEESAIIQHDCENLDPETPSKLFE